MKKRNILFGYQYRDGVIAVCPKEMAVLERIFTEYQNGLSLLDIADRLNADEAEYQSGVTRWNKSRIMRLIEDERYTGKDGFPELICEETRRAMMGIKAGKNTQCSTDRSADIFHIDVPVACPACGSSMIRRNNKRAAKCPQRWICQSSGCRTVIHKADDVLLDDIMILLNSLIVNPELVNIPTGSDQEPSMAVRKMENEIGRMLDTLDYDKASLRQKMLECASLKYAGIAPAPYTALRLKAAFAKAEPLSAFSLPLFKRTVKEIRLDESGVVSIKLWNDQVVGEDEENAADDGNAEENSTEDTRQGGCR